MFDSQVAKDLNSLGDQSHAESRQSASGLSGLLAQGIMGNSKNSPAAESASKKDENLLSVSKLS